MEELMHGNAQFAAGADSGLLRELARNGQKPVAAIVACSDSRVPVELIFNQCEPGKIFVIRVAGNIISDASVKGSIEYAVEHLGVRCLIILGHSGCGAVQASLDKIVKGELGRLLAQMKIESSDLVAAVVENVNRQVSNSMEIDAVRQSVEERKLGVFGAVYDIETGKVQVVSRNGIKIH